VSDISKGEAVRSWPRKTHPGNQKCPHVYVIERQPNGHPLLVCLNCPREVR
jgi:hypothetical protein